MTAVLTAAAVLWAGSTVLAGAAYGAAVVLTAVHDRRRARARATRLTAETDLLIAEADLLCACAALALGTAERIVWDDLLALTD